MRADVTAVILAGGAGRRMGGAIKSLIQIDGTTIFERQRAVLAPRVGAIAVSASAAPWAPVPVIADTVADGGPLAGIAAALAAVATPWILVVAGDMPWLAGGVIDRILAAADAGAAGGAVVPRIGGYPEPLCAAYHAGARAAIEAALGRGEASPSRLIGSGAIPIRWLEAAALRDVDPELRSFASVNAPVDLA